MRRSKVRSMEAQDAQDALSLDELDTVVGGAGDAQNREGQLTEFPPEGGYHPPAVTAPAHLPDPINQIETQVTNHAITADVAVTQIAELIGHQPDHSMQSIAGAEIASLVGRGLLDANAAITDLHNAVTQSHTLTGEQATGVLAGMILAQSITTGESATIATTAHGEIAALVSGGQVTADHAITAIAGIAGAGSAGFQLISEMTAIATQNSVSPASVAADISATVDSHDLSGTEAVSLLIAAASRMGGLDIQHAAGHEIADLVAHHGVSVADAMAGIDGMTYGGESVLIQVMAVAGAENHDLLAPSGVEIAHMLQRDSFFFSSAQSYFENQVANGTLSLDQAITMLLGTATGDPQNYITAQPGWASTVAVDLIEQRHFSATDVMTDIRNAVTAGASADGAAALLLGIATNGGYGASLASTADACLVQMLNSGQVDPAHVASMITQVMAPNASSAYYSGQAMQVLLSIGESSASGAEGAVTTALQSLLTSGAFDASHLISLMASRVGANTVAGIDAAFDAAVLREVTDLVAAGSVSTDTAITALANAGAATFRTFGRPEIVTEIESLAAASHLSATQVMADVMASDAVNSNYWGVMAMLTFLSGGGHDFQAAAVSSLLSLVDGVHFGSGNDLISGFGLLVGYEGLPADTGVGLLAALVGDGTTAVHADAAATQIAGFINGGNIGAGQAMADIHASVAGGILGGDAALALLANIAANSTTARVAVNSEMVALVSGTPPLIPPGHASEVLNALEVAATAANNTALMGVITSEIAVLAASDPAQAVFQGLDTTTSNTDLDSAATQLAAMLQSGGTSLTTVMNDIDHAFTTGALTAPQAATLLADIAVHGNLAAQVAAGTEFANIVNSAGTGVLNGPGAASYGLYQVVLGVVGVAMGGTTFGTMPATHTSTLSVEGAYAFLLGAIGSPTISDANRQVFQMALGQMSQSGFQYSTAYFPVGQDPQTRISLAPIVNDLLSSHAMPGAEVIRVVNLVSWLLPSNELGTLIANQSLSIADVHSAITSNWWQIDDAVRVLTSQSATPAVMAEIDTLLSAGTITVGQVISDIHGVPAPLSADDYVRLMDKFAASNDSNTQHLVANELASALIHGLVSDANVQAILTAAGANHDAIADMMIGQIGSVNITDSGLLLGHLVTANVATFDHIISQLADQTGTLVNAVQFALRQNALDADQVTTAFMAAVSSGTLTGAQAQALAIGMADTPDLAMSNTAGALLAAAVSSGHLNVQTAMNALTLNSNRYAHVLQGAAAGIGTLQMNAVLNSFVAHCAPGSVGAVCQEAMTLVAYSFFSSSMDAFPLMIVAAGHADTNSLHTIGAILEGMIERNEQSVASVASAINAAFANGLTGVNAIGIYTNIAQYAASHSVNQVMSDAIDQIGTLVPAHASAAIAVAALNNLMNSASTALSNAAYTLLAQAIGAEIDAIAAANPDADALSSIDDAIRAGTMTGAQAATMLAGMMHGSTFSTGVADEINTLLSNHLMTAWQFADAVVAAATAQSPAAIVATLAELIDINPAFGTAIGGHIQQMVAMSQISAQDAVYALNGTINHPLTIDHFVEVMTALCSPNAPGAAALTTAVVADITMLLGIGSVMSLGQVVAGIDHSITNGAAPVENAVTLLSQLAPMSTEATAAAAQEIVGLIASNQIAAAAAFGYASWATAATPDHGFNFLMDIAANSTAACQLAFGNYVAGLVGQGTMSADQAVGFVRDAYAAQLHNPVHDAFTPGFVTAGQELKLLANILAGMASPGHLDATALIAPVHAEFLAAMHTPPTRATDTQIVAALQEIGLSGGPILAAANAEITRLEADPKVLIDVAVQTGLDMGDVGSQLATLIGQGTLSVSEAMGDILAANAAHNLSNDQALTMIVSAVAHAASAGIYLQQQTSLYANNWLLATSNALERLAQNGLSPDAIGNAFHGVIGQGPGLLFPSDAVAVLASAAAYADLQGMAATQIVGMLANPSFNLYPNQMADEVAACVSATATTGFLDAGAAAQLLAHIAVAIDTPAAYGGIALGLGDQSSLTQIPPDAVTNAITAMVQSHSLTAEQALHFLTPYGNSAPAAVGHVIGSLIASGQVSMAEFTALIYGGPLQTYDQIQNANYWQQIAGTGSINFASAVVLLAAMTSQTDAAVTELAQIAAADTSFVWNVIETRILDAGQHPETSGLNPREAVRALTILATDHQVSVSTLADDIGRLVNSNQPNVLAQYYMNYGDAVGEVARLAVSGNPDVAQAGMSLLSVLVGQTGAFGNDGIVSAVGNGLTADQAVTVLTDLSLTQSLNMQQHVRADIAYLIGHNQITATQAFADVHAECLARGIGATLELSIYAGVVGSGGTSGAIESAAADAIVGMVSSGRLSLGQAMDALFQATFTTYAYTTQAQSMATYLAGGLSIDNSTALMALVAAHSSDPAAFGVVAAEIAGMLGAYSATDRSSVMAGIDAVVSSGLLSAEQAVVLLASTPLGATDDAKSVIGGEFVSLVSNGHITVDQAVAAIEGMAHNGTAMQQMQAGAAIGLLVVQNQLTAADAVGGVVSALAGNALTPDQAVSVLAGMNAGGSATLANTAANAIMALVGNHSETGPHALSLLMNAAGAGTGAMLSGLAVAIDAMIAGNAVTAAQVMQSVDVAFGSGALSTPAATTLLVDIGRTSDVSLQAAIGHELGAIVQNCNAPNAAVAALGQQLAATLSQDQSVVMLAAAIAGAGATTQTPLAALIATMIDNGPIGLTQVLGDIDAAVTSHAMTAPQALVALAHLEEAVSTNRMTVVNEATALVSNGQISATDAAQTLLGASHGGSTALQSLIGGMLASLADHNLLTNQQIVDAVSGATTINNTEALGVLMGMGVNGNAAAQAASGAGILSLIESGRIDVQTVTQLIDYESTHNGITPEHGVQVLLNVMGAAIGDVNAGASGLGGAIDRDIRDRMLSEVVSLVQNAHFVSIGANRVLLQTASYSMVLAEAVGRCCSVLGTNAAIVGGGELWDAVHNGGMSADQAMTVAFFSSLSLQPQGQWTFASLVQSGAVSADQAIHFLAMAAARSGDSDPNLPYLAYSGAGSSDQDVMNAALADMLVLVHGAPGGNALTTSATLLNDVAAAAVSHDLTGMQAASMLAVLGGKLGGADALLAANAIGSLVTQHLIDNVDALHAIGWAGSAGLTADLANTMYADMALSADPDVRQVAIWHFTSSNLGSETLAHALHAVTTNALFTPDQALAILCNVTPGILDGYQFTAANVASTLAAEITWMVTSHQITADHALAVLAGSAASSDFILGSLGADIAALVTAGAISLDHALTDLAQGGLNADQLVTVLGRMSGLDHAWDTQIVSQISAMVAAGRISADQAMADLGTVHNQMIQDARSHGGYSPGFAMELLAAFVNAGPALEAAAAAECATLIGQGTLSSYNLWTYALAHYDMTHAYGWIVSVASYGNTDLQNDVDTQIMRTFQGNPSDITNYLLSFLVLRCAPHVQYYIGQELGRFADHTPTPTTIIDTVDLRIPGTALNNEITKDVAQGAKNMHISVDSLLPTKLPSDTTALVLLGISSTTHNTDVATRVNADQTLVGKTVDAQFVANVAQALPPDQALTQFANIVQHGFANTALVAKQLADMVAAGTVTAPQVIAAMSTMDTNHQLALVTDILGLHETGSSAFVSQFATLTLLIWGVAPTSQTYTQLHDAISQAVPDFVGLVRGTTTAQQAITDLRAVAAANNVSVDVLLMATFQAAAQDPSIGAQSLSGALSTIGHEIYTHLTDGSAANAVAQMVVGGAMSESAAAALVQELATCATIPPNAIMSQVASGNMSVWYADAHYAGWSSNAAEVQFTVTQAVAMMHVDVHVATDAAAVLAGTMTAQAAVDDVLAAGNGSDYAMDLGLMALAHGLANAPGAVQDTIGLAVTARVASGETEGMLVTMASHGWLSAQGAVDMLENEVRLATTGVSSDAASMFEAVALARLDLAASGQTDPNATVAQQQAHQHDTSSSIQNLIEGANAARILMGLGALQTVGNDTYLHGAGLALSQHLMGVVVTQLADQEAANPGSTGSTSSTPDWAHSLPPAVQQAMHYADIASQFFTLGIGSAVLLNVLGEKYAPVASVMNIVGHPVSLLVGAAPSLLELAVAKYAPATDIAALTTNVASVQTWVNLGVDVAVNGVPAAGVIGLPSWAGGIQANLLNDALGDGAGMTFMAANIGSKAALYALEMGVVKDWLGDHPALNFMAGTLRTELGLVSESCSLISGMISGTVHTAANMVLAAGTATFETFKDIFTGHDAASDATQLGKTLFVLMTGASFESVSQVGEDVGNAMVDIFSGHPQELGPDLEAIGKDSLHMIASNPFLQMASSQAYTYLQKLDDLLGHPEKAYTSDGLKQFLGLPSDVSWDTMFQNTFKGLGGSIADGATDVGNTIAGGFRSAFHI